MIHRITNRNALRTSEWLAAVATNPWTQVTAPPRELLKVQQFDAVAQINDALVVEQINDAFAPIAAAAGEPSSRAERVNSDGQMAAAIHQTLSGLTLREACDSEMWAWIACCGCSQYVRWRWGTDNSSALWKRFAGNTRRNALSRLWWWAEITHQPTFAVGNSERYSLTRNVRDRQSLMLWFVDCAFSGQPLLAQTLSILQQSAGLNDAAQKRLCRTVNRLARVVCLDSIRENTTAVCLCERALQLSQLITSP
jgi:hypothetical protein